MIDEQRTELKAAVNKMELYQDENKFNLFHEKKTKRPQNALCFE